MNWKLDLHEDALSLLQLQVRGRFFDFVAVFCRRVFVICVSILGNLLINLPFTLHVALWHT